MISEESSSADHFLPGQQHCKREDFRGGLITKCLMWFHFLVFLPCILIIAGTQMVSMSTAVLCLSHFSADTFALLEEEDGICCFSLGCATKSREGSIFPSEIFISSKARNGLYSLLTSFIFPLVLWLESKSVKGLRPNKLQTSVSQSLWQLSMCGYLKPVPKTEFLASFQVYHTPSVSGYSSLSSGFKLGRQFLSLTSHLQFARKSYWLYF